MTKRSVWAWQSVAAEVAGGTAVSRYDSGTDLIRSELAGEGERWYGRDAMGTTTSLTSSTGALTARAEYDAWGERIAETGATANRVGFTGYREDAETGLDHAINRYYSPDTGRFTTHDPLTELDRPERLNQPQGLNLYPYVKGAPTRYTDPDGLDWAYNSVKGLVIHLGPGYGDPEKRAEYEGKDGWEILPDDYKLDATYAWGSWRPYRGHFALGPPEMLRSSRRHLAQLKTVCGRRNSKSCLTGTCRTASRIRVQVLWEFRDRLSPSVHFRSLAVWLTRSATPRSAAKKILPASKLR
ncbi:MAG: RHS repeat-associated core domain-containing protein [Acidobacteria bacterium]|nr:RHS repeat-associated core domain-containing protein [Acidobacteriota bacterium]